MRISLLSSGAAIPYSPGKATSSRKPKFQNASEVNYCSPKEFKFHERGRMNCMVCSALPETTASIVIAAAAIGAAATLLTRTKKTSESDNSSLKTCEDCGGSGICAECKGEGFILKKLSDESADKARMTAKNAATRYTAGLPKKWSYCFKCSSSRSCITCRGSGLINA